jgi:hypothetical protein
MQDPSFYNLLTSATMVSPAIPTGDPDLDILYDIRAQCAPDANNATEILHTINQNSNQERTDALISPQNSWLMAHSIKLGLSHLPHAFTSSRINLSGRLKAEFIHDDPYSTIFPKLDENFEQILREGKKFSITFDRDRNHWVTLFIDPASQKIVFFDPFGTPTVPTTVGDVIKLGEHQLNRYLNLHKTSSTQELAKNRRHLTAITHKNQFGFLMKIKRALNLTNFDNYTLYYTQTRFQFDNISCGQWNIFFSDFVHQHYKPMSTKSCDEQLKEHVTNKKIGRTSDVANLTKNLMHTNLKSIVKHHDIKLPKLTEKFHLDYTNIGLKLLIVLMAVAIVFYYPSFLTIMTVLATLVASQLIASLYSFAPFYNTIPQFISSESIPSNIMEQKKAQLEGVTSYQTPKCVDPQVGP